MTVNRLDQLSVAEKRAFGPLIDFIGEPSLRDLLAHVTDGDGVVWLDHGRGLRRATHPILNTTELRSLARALISVGGRHIDDLQPCADVRLGQGIRVHAVLSPIVAGGAAISIRFPTTASVSFTTLVEHGLCDNAAARYLRDAISTRRNILVTGATASGKTTLLAALLDEVAPHERILTIEDVRELRLRHPHHVALEARQAGAEGTGEVGLDRLLREALRMRPDWLVLGECRGAEVATLLMALNTGHGGAGTMHANGTHEIAARLEALGSLAGLSPVTLARQVVSALHLVVHLTRDHGEHRIEAIASPQLGTGGLLRVEPITVKERLRANIPQPVTPTHHIRA